MSKNTCCSICRCTNTRTVNIYGTNLQYVYETLANFKITDVECWVCYICHTKLRQCHQLLQLAMQTRGVPEILVHNMVKVGVYRSVLELSTSGTLIISTSEPSLYIKQETDVKKEVCSDNELEAEFEGNKENKTNIKSDYAPTGKVLEVTFEKVSQSEIDEHDQYPTTSSGYPKVKQERAENIRDEGVDQIKQDTEYKTQDASEAAAKKLHKSNVCSMRFPTKSLLVSHSRTHTGEKPYGYDVCSKKFSRKVYLNHMLTQSEDKPHICDICSKQYKRIWYLQKHLLIHSENKGFSCKVCSKKFTERRYLESHSFLHTGIRNYTCDVCSLKFSTKGGLNLHKHTHMGYEPHNCDLCSKSFSRKRHLRLHVQMHTGEKLFSCDTCLKKFKRKGNLKVHSLTHIHT